MHFTTAFFVATFALAVHAVPSARTFVSSQHPEHAFPTHNHEHQHNFAGAQHGTANHGHQVQVEDDSSVSVLVCQVVKVPVGQSGARPTPPADAAAPAAGAGSPSIVASSQEALSNLTTRVRTAMDSLVEPVVAALQNASLWLNRTSQIHLNQPHEHSAMHQHSGHAHHAHQHAAQEHQHQHGGQVNQHAHNDHATAAHGHQPPQSVHGEAVPMTVVSVPVMIPTVHAGSFPLVNMSAIIPGAVDMGSLHFSGSVRDSSSEPPAQPVTAASHSASPGTAGGKPTSSSTDAAVTPAPHVSTSGADSQRVRARVVRTPPPIIHVPVCPDYCCR
ncbi:hypothetical protein HPB50_020610 [Hyalomma asiaticum]|uniref:Uncharacterized protein n=1 Tax=Hyalomma asiaticum TaxID=266040 RepID=A0ACB7S114_HYAAI|nr:hypothetical protein HPB50_020610 [Hyalomma asiaticum]